MSDDPTELAPPPEVQLVAPQEVAIEVDGAVALQQLVRDSARPIVRPKRMTSDVWAIAREYAEDGGLLDMAEDIASLAEMELKVRDHPKIALADKAQLVGQIVERRVRAKKSHMQVQKDLELVITHDRFMSLLEDISEVLLKHLGEDPTLLANIGRDIGRIVRRLRDHALS